MKLQQKNINFGAKTLYPMMVKKAVKNGYRLVKADFAELSVTSKRDLQCIKELKRAWRYSASENNYISDIAQKFQDDTSFETPPIYRYFVVRLASGKKKMSQKIASVMAVKIAPKELLFLDYIQSASQVKHNSNVPKVKGAGELGILGLIKLAKKNFLKKLSLSSVADSFYEKLGFQYHYGHIRGFSAGTHHLPQNKFNCFIKKTEKKYNIQ